MSSLIRRTKVSVKVGRNLRKLERKLQVNKIQWIKQKLPFVNTEPKCAKWRKTCKAMRRDMAKMRKKLLL